jgi:hypothetical protein
MDIDPKAQQANADIGGYLLMKYGGLDGSSLRAANAVSALGALAGVFAQAQARAMLAAKSLPDAQASLVEVATKDGEVFYFGDAINACLFEGARERPSFWNIAAGVARDPDIGAKVDIAEIAKHTAEALGGPDFGKPRIEARYPLTEMPIDAVKAHALVFLDRFRQTGIDPAQLMIAFGLAAQGIAAFAAGDVAGGAVDVAMTREDIVRLYMESAIPMSKLDLRKLGMVPA